MPLICLLLKILYRLFHLFLVSIAEHFWHTCLMKRFVATTHIEVVSAGFANTPIKVPCDGLYRLQVESSKVKYKQNISQQC